MGNTRRTSRVAPPPRRQRVDTPVRQPQPRWVAVLAGGRHHLLDGGGRGHVERDVDVAPAFAVEVLERGHAGGQLVATQRRHRPAQPRQDARVDEHGNAVCGQRHVALDAGGAERTRLAERGHRVLEMTLLRAAAVGEPDGQIGRSEAHRAAGTGSGATREPYAVAPDGPPR